MRMANKSNALERSNFTFFHTVCAPKSLPLPRWLRSLLEHSLLAGFARGFLCPFDERSGAEDCSGLRPGKGFSRFRILTEFLHHRS